jgi:nicotinate-nucleotide adenylyltransferase
VAERIGVFGGTFDPIHLGHLIVAEVAREALHLDRVLFVPAGEPWHRGRVPAGNGAARLEMTRLATADNPHFAVSTVDLDRRGPTYTVETLRILQEQNPGARLVFLLGADALAQIGIWHEPARIPDLAEVVALTRPGAPPIDPASLESVIPGAAEKIRALETPLIGISATEIRRRVKAGLSIHYQVVPAVERYIREQKLYR